MLSLSSVSKLLASIGLQRESALSQGLSLPLYEACIHLGSILFMCVSARDVQFLEILIPLRGETTSLYKNPEIWEETELYAVHFL